MADQAVETKSNEARAGDAPGRGRRGCARRVRCRRPRPSKAVGRSRRRRSRRLPKAVAGRPPSREEAVAAANPERSRGAAGPGARQVAEIARAGREVAKPPLSKPSRQEVKTMTTQNRSSRRRIAATEQSSRLRRHQRPHQGRGREERQVVEELTELAKGNVEALVASSQGRRQGLRDPGPGRRRTTAARASRTPPRRSRASPKSSRRPTSSSFRAISPAARSTRRRRSAEDHRTVLKLAGDVAQPLTSRYAVAAERVKTVAALTTRQAGSSRKGGAPCGRPPFFVAGVPAKVRHVALAADRRHAIFMARRAMAADQRMAMTATMHRRR